MKKISKRFTALFLSLLMVISMIAGNGITTQAAGTPKLLKKSASIAMGGTARIKVKNAPKGAKITYQSAKNNIATVSSKGKVKGVKTGTTKITVLVKKSSHTTKLSYKVNVKKPKLAKSKLSLTVGKTETLSVKYKPKKAKTTWTSSKPKVASVSKSGKVTAKVSGTTIIKAKVKYGKKSYTSSCKVTVSKVPVYTVTFNSNGGSTVASQSVEKNKPAKQPAEPTREGYFFDGWYTAANGGTKFDFSAVIMGNLTLYAHWIRYSKDEGSCRITFDMNDGSANIHDVQMLQKGDKIQKPSSDPTRNLYRFTGWYTEPACVTAYNFNKPAVTDLTLYAGWGNPDGSADIYSATDDTETIYSITAIDVVGNDVVVTYNTKSQCLMAVEFFDDYMSESDWSDDAQDYNLNISPIATASGYTESYGEMKTVVLPIEGDLPEYFVARATLYGTDEEEAPSYVTNQYTETYEEFDAKTVDTMEREYGEESVINFDNKRSTNFGVLKDNVKTIDTESLVNGFDVVDVDLEDEVVPEHQFTFTNANAQVRNVQAGDIVYIEDTSWLFKVKTASQSNGTVTLTQDKEASMTDFYDVLKVDMQTQTENTTRTSREFGIDPQIDIIDIDASLSGSFNPSVSHKFSNGITLEGKITGKITGNVKMSYDAHLFSKDYFECSVSFATEISSEVKASMSRDNTNEWKNVVYQFDTRKIKLPTPITGLNVYAKPAAKIDWKLSGSVSIKAVTKQTSGFNYNSETGRTDIKKKENTISLMAEGKAEVKMGPNIDIGVELLGGVLSAGVGAEAGLKFTATATTGFDDFTNTADSKHACGLCVSGKAEWYATASIKCSYKITDGFKGDIANVTILDFKAPVYFIPHVPSEFFVSVINSADSPFGGRMKFGGGSCTNKTYRTEFQVVDENGHQISGAPVAIIKQGQTSVSNGRSPYVTYLYSGKYSAVTNVKNKNIAKTCVVGNSRQIVTLSEQSADGKLTGTIVDAKTQNKIKNASVKVTKDGVVIASAKSDSDGSFSVDVAEGSLQVDIIKDGYIAFNSTEKVYEKENHSMGIVELSEGDGQGGFYGVIRNATDNSTISGVTLNLYKGWNSKKEPNTAIRTLTTDSYGEFSYETVTLFGKVLGLPCGNYTLSASKEGYSDTSYNIVIYPGSTYSNPSINEVMSPSMNKDEYRIILTWGMTPEDLDSHLVANTDVNEKIHVYYSDSEPYPYYANLDVDDTDSEGPETITITNFNGLSNIRYAVHDYTNYGETSSTALSYSNAVVRIFKGDELLRTFKVPTGFGGTEWDVFSMDSQGRITAINTMTYRDDPDNVLGGTGTSRSVARSLQLKDYELSKTVNERVTQ